MVCSKSAPGFHKSLLLGHVSTSFLYALACSPKSVLNCVKMRTDWQPQIPRNGSRVFLDAETRLSNMHNLRKMLCWLKLCMSNGIDIRAFWWSLVKRWRLFPKKPDCQTCVVDWCYNCYGNYTDGSRPTPNFFRQNLIFSAKNYLQPACFGKVGVQFI